MSKSLSLILIVLCVIILGAFIAPSVSASPECVIKTPTPMNGTPVSVATPTPYPTTDFSCPAGTVEGEGILTPDNSWLATCAQCLSTTTPFPSPTFVSATLVPDAVYENDSGFITYSGGWTLSSHASYSGGNARVSNVVGKYYTFTFIGQAFELMFLKGPTAANFEVYVDNVLVSTVSAYSATWVYQSVWLSGTYAYASHVVKVVHASGTMYNVDRVRIISSVLPTPTVVPTVTATPQYWISPDYASSSMIAYHDCGLEDCTKTVGTLTDVCGGGSALAVNVRLSQNFAPDNYIQNAYLKINSPEGGNYTYWLPPNNYLTYEGASVSINWNLTDPDAIPLYVAEGWIEDGYEMPTHGIPFDRILVLELKSHTAAWATSAFQRIDSLEFLCDGGDPSIVFPTPTPMPGGGSYCSEINNSVSPAFVYDLGGTILRTDCIDFTSDRVANWLTDHYLNYVNPVVNIIISILSFMPDGGFYLCFVGRSFGVRIFGMDLTHQAVGIVSVAMLLSILSYFLPSVARIINASSGGRK